METKIFEQTFTVTEDKTAQAMGSGDLPVLATPAMIAAMENAAMLCAADLLEEGMTTVGVHMNAEHNKASAIGAKVTARATLVEHTGRSFHFTVEAYEGDEQVGVGEHTRVAVDRVRFMAKLAK
ncbi:MAG: thioesterase family protein [Pygmaiobacter massiliensis]|nr:thioesterase family protein [Pygmaiobacter massiliensis]